MTAEKVNCPRCGVIQVKSDECIVCGYSFAEGNGSGNQRKQKLFTPPTEKKKAGSKDGKKTKKAKKKFQLLPLGVAGVKSLWFTPGVKLLLIVIAAIASFIILYQYTLRSDIQSAQNAVIINQLRVSPEIVPRDQLAAAAMHKIKKRLRDTLDVRGDEVNPEDISIEPAEMTTAFLETVKKRGYAPEDYRVVLVSGSFTFRWLGISWGKREISFLGGYNTSIYDKKAAQLDEQRHRKQEQAREILEKRLLNIGNELSPVPPVQPVSQ